MLCHTSIKRNILVLPTTSLSLSNLEMSGIFVLMPALAEFHFGRFLWQAMRENFFNTICKEHIRIKQPRNQ